MVIEGFINIVGKELYLKCIKSKGLMFNGFTIGKEYHVLGRPAIIRGKVMYSVEDDDGYSWTLYENNGDLIFKLIEK